MKPEVLPLSPPDDREELARAEAYGLLAALFYAPPAAALHAQLAMAPTEAPAPGAFLERSWGELVGAARRLSPPEIAAEFDVLFVALGKPEVFLFGSYYQAGALNERPLVALRHELAELGLARDAAMSETEDHIAYLCEVMRYLIAGEDAGVSNLARQQRFFSRHLQGWAGALCDTLAAHPRADFYRALAGFARDFFDVEAQAFDLMDA